MDEPLFYTVRETAQLTRLSAASVYRAVERGELPSVRIGGSLRIPRAAIEELLASAAGSDK